jgi:oligoribonuclease
VGQKSDVLVWLDLEMTGLDPETCVIVQLGMVLTDNQLNEIAPPLEITIWQPESVLQTMSPFVRNMHEKSGLLDQIRTSKTSLAEAEQQAFELVCKNVGYRSARLCGNSIGQDRRFLAKYMPMLEGYLHYRQVDVSTLKELSSWWYNKKFDKPDVGKHTALHDIRQSIAELKFYRQELFK